MPLKKPTFQSSKSQNDRMFEEELLRKLKRNLFLFITIITVLVISITFFGPKVGSLFFIFSKHRNEKEKGDIAPPTAPIFSQVPEATNKKELTLNGVSEPGATVTLFLNGPEKERTTADNNGTFTFANINLNEGQNIIFAKAKDLAENESDKSRTYYVNFDDKKPEIKLLEPKENETVRNLNKRIYVKGQLNEQAEVKINGLNALVNSDNTFEIVLGVAEGDVEIKIQATDNAGNKTEETVKVRYQKSS
uniref:Bacterial Ig-like domain-containing protein n=1 Tax=candidate division WWE3 bacterium TaxID=2053526 RepID=A0A7C4TRY7_UNCKA